MCCTVSALVPQGHLAQTPRTSLKYRKALRLIFSVRIQKRRELLAFKRPECQLSITEEKKGSSAIEVYQVHYNSLARLHCLSNLCFHLQRRIGVNSFLAFLLVGSSVLKPCPLGAFSTLRGLKPGMDHFSRQMLLASADHYLIFAPFQKQSPFSSRRAATSPADSLTISAMPVFSHLSSVAATLLFRQRSSSSIKVSVCMCQTAVALYIPPTTLKHLFQIGASTAARPQAFPPGSMVLWTTAAPQAMRDLITTLQSIRALSKEQPHIEVASLIRAKTQIDSFLQTSRIQLLNLSFLLSQTPKNLTKVTRETSLFPNRSLVQNRCLLLIKCISLLLATLNFILCWAAQALQQSYTVHRIPVVLSVSLLTAKGLVLLAKPMTTSSRMSLSSQQREEIQRIKKIGKRGNPQGTPAQTGLGAAFFLLNLRVAVQLVSQSLIQSTIYTRKPICRRIYRSLLQFTILKAPIISSWRRLATALCLQAIQTIQVAHLTTSSIDQRALLPIWPYSNRPWSSIALVILFTIIYSIIFLTVGRRAIGLYPLGVFFYSLIFLGFSIITVSASLNLLGYQLEQKLYLVRSVISRAS